ncbi:MAG: flagellar basal body P-ring protein FlgI [Planctomycetia bacterium]|nr:flagellar basal body P-ring protein FlgI [Planctomycetia bacterium]
MKNFYYIGIFLILAAVIAGCNKTPDDPVKKEQAKVLENKGRLIGDLASPINMHFAKMEGIALIRGLNNTGANEPPSTYQQLVLKDLNRDVEKKKTAQQEIASMSTAIVLLEANIPPGAKKGDRLDVEVSLPKNSEATSIEGGYIETVSMHQFMAKDMIRTGDKLGSASGSVVLDPQLLKKGDVRALKKGRIIGGAVVSKDRPVWLQLKDGEQTVGVAQRVEDVINSRFSYIKNGIKKNVAEARAPAIRISIIIPEEYKENVNRFMNVLCSISFFESPSDLKKRLDELKLKLLDPQTSELASLQLEAIGPNHEAVLEILRSGMASSDSSVRFHSAISVAYMNPIKDRNDAANILADLARDHAKLRPAALAVLGTCLKTSFQADNRLREFLASEDNELRYGAFRALWTRNSRDYMIQGENMGDQFSYHALNCGGPPMVHLTHSKRPEIVLFTKDNIFMQGDFNIEAGSRITVRSDKSEVIVKKYNTGVDDQRIVSYRLDEVIRAIVDVGGTYPDMIQFLCKAQEQNHLLAYSGQKLWNCPLAIDALPSNSSSFKRIRDPKDFEKTASEEKVEKLSWKDRVNPAHWFSSKEKKKDSGDEEEDEVSASNEF